MKLLLAVYLSGVAPVQYYWAPHPYLYRPPGYEFRQQRPPAVPPRARSPAAADTREQEARAEIEGEIMAFCDDHPSERFCGMLMNYLQQYKERR